MQGYENIAAQGSKALRQAGIPGIKYLDQQSRNAGGWHLTSPDNTVRGKWMLKSSDYNSNGVFFDTQQEAQSALKEKLGKETRNFVTFPGEEKNLTILERNGQPSALKAEETWAGFATPEQYNAAKFYGQNETERWPAAWQRAGAVTPEEILRGKGIVQPPPTQRDKDLYLLESRFSGYMDASKARQFLENDMLKATKKEKDLLRKYYDASGKFIAREEVPVQQAMQEFEQGLANFMATR